MIPSSKPRDNDQPLYEHLGIIKLLDINKYLTGRFMFRYYNGQLPRLFYSFSYRNNDFHQHNKMISDHYHIPSVKSDLIKTGIKYRGTVIWNAVLHNGIDYGVSEAVFVKRLRKVLCNIPSYHDRRYY